METYGKVWRKEFCWVLLGGCLLILLITGFVVSSTFTDNGKYIVKETLIQMDGYTLSGTLYVPKAALVMDEEGNFTNKAPALIAQGGGGTTRSVEEDFTVELIKRGFVVFLFDAYNHGLSDQYDYGSHYGEFLHVNHAIEYVQSLNFVDTRNIGYTGHSQGGRSTQYALSRYAGFYTLQDLLFNMLHDELGVTVTAEQVASQDADAVAGRLGDYERGYYNGRKEEITHQYTYGRVTYGISQGQVMRPWMIPKVVEVAGNPVYRNMQANFAAANAQQDESSSSRSIHYPTDKNMRAVCGTGEENVEPSTIYSVNLSPDDEPALSTVVSGFDASSRDNPAVREAAANYGLRLLVQFPGWHTANYREQKNIDCVVEFSSLATGYNNGYLADTNGANAAPMGGTTWKSYDTANMVSIFTLLVLIGAIAVLMLRSRFCEPILGEAPAPQLSKKDPVNWAFLLVVVLLPLFLMAPVVNYNNENLLIGMGWASAHGRVNNILLWALASTIVLLAIITVKWVALDKKKYDVNFCDFYGLNCKVKSILLSLIYAIAVFAIVYTIISLYRNVFNGASFNLMYFNIVHFKVISAQRYLDMVLYSLYFLPFWIVSGMLVASFRMRDMPDGLTTVILAAVNGLGIGAYVYIQYMGYVWTKDSPGGLREVLGLDWGLLYLIVGLVIALPAAVVYTRKLHKRTGSVLPGAFLNTLVFTLLQLNNVLGN